MSHPVQGLAANLCDLSAPHIAWARAAAQRLNAVGFETKISPQRGNGPSYYWGESLAFLPLRDTPLRGAAAEELVRVLTANEALLGEVEKALGVAAEFADMRQLAEDWPIITVERDGEELGRLAVLEEIVPAVPAPPAIGMRCAFIAARLTISDAEALEAGDMVVLTHGPWPLLATDDVRPDAVSARPGLPQLGLDPFAGRLVPILADSGPPGSDPVLKGVSSVMPPSDPSGGLAVPVAIHLADTVITQAELARMAESGTFDLGAVSEGLTAKLSVGGRMIGQGEIVRIGDRFAVLLSQSEVASSSPVAEEEAANGQSQQDSSDHPEMSS